MTIQMQFFKTLFRRCVGNVTQMCQKVNFVAEAHENTQVYQQQCLQTKCYCIRFFAGFLIFLKFQCMCVYFLHISIANLTNPVTCNTLPFQFRYRVICQFFIFIILFIAIIPFLPSTPRQFQCAYCWDNFFCHLLQNSSDINLIFENQKLCKKILYNLTCQVLREDLCYSKRKCSGLGPYIGYALFKI